jgi:hypothetical protein
MKTHQVLIAGLALAAGAAMAQNAPPPPQERHMPPMHEMGPGPGGPEIGFAYAEMVEMHEQIKGAPYAATAVTESTQVFGDGNRIVNKHSGLVARDGEGRIRREESMGHIGPLQIGGPNVIFIHDPVAQAAYVLNPDTKTARVITMEGMHDMHRKITALNEGAEPGHGETGQLKKKEAMEGAVAGRHGEMGQLKKESLGTQQIEGVTAEGTRITRTIPAGTIGNEKSFDITLETWTSTDLHVLVLSKRNDPRSGETVFRLTNIKRGEPDAALFQVPSGFTTQQEQPMRMRGPGPPPQTPQD